MVVENFVDTEVAEAEIAGAVVIVLVEKSVVEAVEKFELVVVGALVVQRVYSRSALHLQLSHAYSLH